MVSTLLTGEKGLEKHVLCLEKIRNMSEIVMI